MTYVKLACQFSHNKQTVEGGGLFFSIISPSMPIRKLHLYRIEKQYRPNLAHSKNNFQNFEFQKRKMSFVIIASTTLPIATSFVCLTKNKNVQCSFCKMYSEILSLRPQEMRRPIDKE